MVFIQGEILRLSVNRGAAAENERLDLSRLHCLHQADSALYVVSVIVDRLFNRLANRLQPCKVDYGSDIVGSERTFEQLGVT